jgi:WD40 repeat protein
VSFSPDGTKVASGSNDNTVKLWDVASGKCLQTLKGKYIWGHSFSPNGMIVVLGPSKQNPEKVTINRYVFTSSTSSFERNQDELRTRSALKF